MCGLSKKRSRDKYVGRCQKRENMKFSTTSYAYTSHYYISKSTSLSRLAAILLLGLSYCVTTSTCDKDDAFVDADKKKSCVPFAKLEFGPESPSIFVIEAKGRLGNHLVSNLVKVHWWTVDLIFSSDCLCCA